MEGQHVQVGVHRVRSRVIKQEIYLFISDIWFGCSFMPFLVCFTDLDLMPIKGKLLRYTQKLIIYQKQYFYLKALSVFCKKYSDLIPINFILAFFVAQVVNRWWSQWNVSIFSKYFLIS